MNREWLTERLRARPPLPEDQSSYENLLLNPAIEEWLHPPPLEPFNGADALEMLGEDQRHWAEHGFGGWRSPRPSCPTRATERRSAGEAGSGPEATVL